MSEENENTKSKKTAKWKKMLKEIRASGSTFPVDLSLGLDEDLGAVQNTLADLTAEGLIEEHEGYYHLTYKGLKFSTRLEESADENNQLK